MKLAMEEREGRKVSDVCEGSTVVRRGEPN